MKYEKETKAYALKNALEHSKADVSRVLPKLFQHGLKQTEIKEIMPSLNKIVGDINSLSRKEMEEQFDSLKNIIPEKEEKEKDLPEINLDGIKKVVTRMAPEPSKYNHLGHALTFLLNYVYARKYDGKCLLRFEDTNPEKVMQEYIDAMKEDVLDYLGIKPDGIRYVSDDMPLLLEYAEKLVNMDKAYMCFCDREKMQNLRHEGKECVCRTKNAKENLEHWKKFREGKYKEGECVLRIKGDMKSQNHVMRDSVIYRAVKAEHYKYKDKYKVWPMFDFYNPIEDSLMGVTLILRSNEFDLRVELQDYIKELLGLKKQLIIQYGRFNVTDFTTKGRETRELVESGELTGWDDPRLITLKALRRRGVQREAIYELVKQVGLSKHEVNLNFDMIAAINRKIIDSSALRYSFLEDPIELKIKNIRLSKKIKEAIVPVHPDKKETRKIKVDKIFISKKDFDKYKGEEVRLLHLFNIKLNKESHEGEFTSSELKPIQKVNWVSGFLNCSILMPDGKKIRGIAEEAIKTLKNSEILQFERFGFVKLEKRGKNEYEFIFTHK